MKKIIKLILIFCIMVFSISLYLLIKNFQDYEINNKNIKNLEQKIVKSIPETQEYKIDWTEVKSINNDIIAWIKIDNTQINYPILKDNINNLLYLTHSYNGQYNKHGSIFTVQNNPFETEETMIYGHNMRDRTMFSQLENYLDKEFFQNHLDFKIYTANHIYECQVISAYSIEVKEEEKNIKTLNFDEKIKYYKKTSKYKVDTDDEINKIVKLSTCSYINANTSPTTKRCYVIASVK